MRLSPSAICVALVASVGPAACCSGASGGHPPTPSATGAPAAAPSALAPAGSASAAIAAGPPTPPECEALWERYHAVVPDDPYVARDSFIARCSRSTRQVLTCPERAREQVIDIVRQSPFERDGGIEGPPEEQVVGALLHVAMPSRTGICIARERLRFALDAGELASLAARPRHGRRKAVDQARPAGRGAARPPCRRPGVALLPRRVARPSSEPSGLRLLERAVCGP
jgi:hypothetical protein